MTKRAQEESKGLPEWANRLREWLDDMLPTPAPEVVPVPVPVRRPAMPTGGPKKRSNRRRRRR